MTTVLIDFTIRCFFSISVKQSYTDGIMPQLFFVSRTDDKAWEALEVRLTSIPMGRFKV